MLRRILLLFSIALLVFIGSAQAQTYYGNWIVDLSTTQGFVYAANINDSGGLFGQYCYLKEGTCLWLLAMKTACKEGEKYVVLVNSDMGVLTLDLHCDGQLANGNYRYVFGDFDDVDALVKSANRMGFAIALKGGEFIVVRFVLSGGNQAISAMRKEADKWMSVPRTGTRDQRM